MYRSLAQAIAFTSFSATLPRMSSAAMAGFGLVSDVDHMLQPLFDSGALVPVMPRWLSPEYSLHALWHPGKPVAPRVTAFVDFLVAISRRAS